MVTSKIVRLSPDEFARLLWTDEATEDSIPLITVGPMPNDRTRPERKIASPHIFAEFCRITLNNRVEMMKDCYDTLHLTPTSFSAAGMVFKHRAHQFLREGRTLDIFHILASSQLQGETNPKYIYNEYPDDAGRRRQFILPRLEVRLVDKDTQRTHELGVYYRPRNPNLSESVDSWVLVRPDSQNPPIILAFQVTINEEECDVNPSGLDWLRALVPRDAQVYHIILTPEAVAPEINVPAGYLTAGFLDGRDVNKAFPVFHCKINVAEFFKPCPT